MSAKQLVLQQISCDGCDVAYPHSRRFIADVRELAAGDGWKNRRVRYRHSNWDRQVDLCPTCEEPKEQT